MSCLILVSLRNGNRFLVEEIRCVQSLESDWAMRSRYQARQVKICCKARGGLRTLSEFGESQLGSYPRALPWAGNLRTPSAFPSASLNQIWLIKHVVSHIKGEMKSRQGPHRFLKRLHSKRIQNFNASDAGAPRNSNPILYVVQSASRMGVDRNDELNFSLPRFAQPARLHVQAIGIAVDFDGGA